MAKKRKVKTKRKAKKVMRRKLVKAVKKRAKVRRKSSKKPKVVTVTSTKMLKEVVPKLPKNTIIRAYKVSDNVGRPPTHPNGADIFGAPIYYIVGGEYEVGKCSTNEFEECDYGLNVGHRKWCLNEYLGYFYGGSDAHRLFVVEFKKSDIGCIPKYTDGKFRVWRFKIIKEVKLAK